MIRFKQTPIGMIPENWEVVRLEDVVEINKESRDPTRKTPNDKFLYIDIESIEGGAGVIKTIKEIIGKDAPLRARRVVHYNNIIMSTVRPYLKAFAIVPKEYDNQICSTGFAVFTCKKKILPLYLLYALFSRSVIEQCNRMMVGGQYPALNSSQVAKIKVPLPPLIEQRKIAEILSTVDEAIQKVDEVIAKTERLKNGLMHEFLTKGINLFTFEKEKIMRPVKKAYGCGDHEFGREENLSSHLRSYLQEEFREYIVDTEVEKKGRLRPDIIIHKRNTNVNLFAVEVKKVQNSRDIKDDVKKLEELMLKKYRYCESIFIGFNIEDFDFIFRLSNKINFILVAPDGEVRIKTRTKVKECDVVRLSDIGEVFTGKTPSTSNNTYWNGEISFITPGDIQEAKYAYKTERYVTLDGAKQAGRILPKDTVLVVCIGSTIGKSAMTYTESVTNQQINAIICGEEAESHYVYYAISFKAELLKSYSGVAAVPIIKKSLFERFKIPLPLFPEQQKIAKLLSTVDKKLELERKRKEKLERIKRGLMNDLLTGKKRVEV
ncbi:MAG: restriction endonuclease subunit S [Halobacteriota archaeon]